MKVYCHCFCYSLGFGDAAALVGKAFGRNSINHPWVEETKTWEGSIAMYLVSAIAIFSLVILLSKIRV
ncbi:diacylglycerol/polyprenol kinase family protein [Lutispora thermophila]|uniref:Uncharacterized protein n=1 Tax=Lutispora thermophila DSM 19022 TaxID=1122184 RepID=A0A1M6EUL4_9FIRM|nr:hypothetical protein [Lutispora thermophila]SHI89174.1 hypothetical protein SAMN02745176_01708 [Lutispora thermophila DSM 19022]